MYAQMYLYPMCVKKIYLILIYRCRQIFCLQEVQASHLPTFYSQFEQIGYVGIFKQKTGNRQDGCAIYFKQSLFELKEHISVSVNNI